ncbi:MAG: putative membrane-anchored protein [Flavobacteriales bacterium]|jgi:uncharacterized membrane-anchored protein
MKIFTQKGASLLSCCIIVLFFLINCSAYSQDDEYEDIEDSLELTLEDIEYQMFADSIEATMVFEVGTIELGVGIAVLVVPQGYKYLDVEQSEYVLNELWGNPPSPSLGMLFEEESNVLSDVGYVIDITYNEMGYIDDEDAADIDYDELEEEMFGDNDEDNRMRVEAGYETIDFIGWASEPYYDATAKKLHWAQELSFGGSDEHTLNYAIRILGRKGVLQMNFISDMTELNNVKADIPLIMPSVNFTEGNQYADFDPDIDTLAAVGIGGLIAGKVLAKGGILIFLAKIWKFLAIGAVAALAYFRKRFSGKKDEVTEELPAKIEDTDI